MPPKIIPGSDNPEIDVRAVQNAVDDPNIDVIVLCGPKPFNFGDGSASQRKTVSIRRGVTILGEVVIPPSSAPVAYPVPHDPFSDPDLPDHAYEIKTRVLGGGAKGDTILGKGDAGPFMVMNERTGGKPVIIAGISFSGWAGEAISATACRSLAVINCEFTNPVPTTPSGEFEDRGLSFVHAIMAVGPECQGSFLAGNNVGIFGDYTPLPADEQLLACILSNFRSINITGNQITGHDEGIEVILNGFGSNAAHQPISIKDNIINLSQLLPENENWKGHTAVVCLKNRNRETEIIGNKITATGPCAAFALSGEKLTVRRNVVTLNRDELNTYPLAGVIMGNNDPPFAFSDVGASLTDSVISNNNFSGVANFGMLTYDKNPFPPQSAMPPLNESHDNVIKDNELCSFQCEIATLLLTRGTYNNQFNGCFPSVFDMGTGNQITNTCPPAPAATSGVELEKALNRFRGLGSKLGTLAGIAERHAVPSRR